MEVGFAPAQTGSNMMLMHSTEETFRKIKEWGSSYEGQVLAIAERYKDMTDLCDNGIITTQHHTSKLGAKYCLYQWQQCIAQTSLWKSFGMWYILSSTIRLSSLRDICVLKFKSLSRDTSYLYWPVTHFREHTHKCFECT
jgi:hypothetical protein